MLAMCGGAHASAQLNQQDKALFDAISSHNPEQVKDALRHHANIEARQNYQTPLMWAASLGNADVIRFLLEKHANVEVKDQFGQTALIYAAGNVNAEVVRLLLENHANVDVQAADGHTPIIDAAIQGHTEVAKALLAFHPDLELGDRSGWTALYTAINMDHLPVAQLLVDAHANIEKPDGNGDTMLMLFAKDGKLNAVKFLLENHANPNAKDNYDHTPLSVAMGAGKADIVMLLLDHNADLEAKDKDGQTPLILAVYWEEADMVKLLLERHANLEAADNDGKTPLLVAAQRGNRDIVKLLLDHNANIEAKDKDGKTPLIVAAHEGNAGVVKLLLDSKANVEARDKGDFTALMEACWYEGSGKNDVIRLLLAHNANIEAVDSRGLTPLIIAAYTGNADAVRLLLARQANEAAKTTQDYKWFDRIEIANGSTAIDAAEKEGNCDSLQALEHGSQDRTLACLASRAEAYRKDPKSTHDLDIVLRTAAAMNPAPEIPQEARRPFVQANTLFKTAQNDADSKTVLGLYQEALSQAPWFADAWYNRSLAQEKAGDHAGAVTSMKNFQQLEPDGAKDQAALDRIYALEGEEKSASDKMALKKRLEDAATDVRKIVGGRTVDRFWLIHKADGSLCSQNGAAGGYGEEDCRVYGSVEYGYSGHDGTALGVGATVTTELDQVVLALGTQRFCIPPDQVMYLTINTAWTAPIVRNITDCNSPAEEVRLLYLGDRAFEPIAGGKMSTVNGMTMMSVMKCPDAECSRADIAIYWLKP